MNNNCKFIVFIISILAVSYGVNLGTINIYKRKKTCSSCTIELPGYCDSFTSLETDFFAGYNKQYLVVGCTYNVGVYIYDLQNMNIVKQWTNRSTVGIPSGSSQHSSSIQIYKSLLVTMEDWDGLEALDYKSSSSGAAIAKTQCTHANCSGDRTIHKQMIQLIDPQTQQGGRFLYAYRKGSIRYTKIIKNGLSYAWEEVRDPLNLNVGNFGVTGISQIEGTKLVIFSTITGFQIYDAGSDDLTKVPTTTDATASDLKQQLAVQIKGTRIIITYDEGVLKVFEFSPPDTFPISIDYVKKHSINRNDKIKDLKSFGGRQVALITQSFAEIWDIGVIDNQNINTSYQMTRLKDLPGVDDLNYDDYSAGIMRITNTNYIIYNNNNYDIIIDYACHFSCGGCNAYGAYGECTTCATSSNSSTASDGLIMEKKRTLRNNQCLCEDNNNPCTYVDIGSQYCYHETAFSDSPTKCCGTNTCKNDNNADKCIQRSELCPFLEQLALIFDPLSGSWYPTPSNPDYDCHYSCYLCIDSTAQKCRSCDDAVTNRELVSSPGECKCKAGYKERNPASSKICEFDAPCVAKCISCSFGVCSQCQGTQTNKDPQTCECLAGYKDDGSDGCIKDCKDSVTKRYLDNGVCVCQNGYQETSPASANCEEKPCVSKCVSCSLGVCSQCEGTQTNKDPQTCECVDGYKFQGIDCVKDCQDSLTNRELFNEKCVCKSGFYEDTVEIENQEKKLCFPIKKGKNREPTKPFNCKAGFYEQENSFDCLPCSPLCKTCTDKNECTECTFSFYNKPPTCRVFSIFNRLNQEENNLKEDLVTCEKQLGCNKCDDQTGKCLECDASLHRELDEISLECVCVPGYKEYKNKEACQKCYYYLGECLITCPKNTEIDPTNQICLDIEYESLGNAIYVIILVAGVLITQFSTTYCIFKISFKSQMKKVQFIIDDGKQIGQQDVEIYCCNNTYDKLVKI